MTSIEDFPAGRLFGEKSGEADSYSLRREAPSVGDLRKMPTEAGAVIEAYPADVDELVVDHDLEHHVGLVGDERRQRRAEEQPCGVREKIHLERTCRFVPGAVEMLVVHLRYRAGYV